MKLIYYFTKWFKTLFSTKKIYSRKINVENLPSRQERRETKNFSSPLNKYSNVKGGKVYYKKAPAIQ